MSDKRVIYQQLCYVCTPLHSLFIGNHALLLSIIISIDRMFEVKVAPIHHDTEQRQVDYAIVWLW